MRKGKKRPVYTAELPARMYSYFNGFAEGGAPSFGKFARLAGVTLADLQKFRRHREFDRAYLECSEIRRDYLIDQGLMRRCDPSLVKYLLSEEFGMDDAAPDGGRLDVTLEVVGE